MSEATQLEVAETVELEIEKSAVEPVEAEESDDPRQAIAKKFAETHRNYSASEEGEEESEEIQADEPTEPEMVTVKINGKERQVEKEKVDDAGGIAIYQKQEAAHENLRIAAENRKILEEQAALLQQREAALAERETALSTDAHNPDLPTKNGDQEALAEKVRKYREALMDGEEEQTDALLVELLAEAQKNATSNDTTDATVQKAIEIIESRNQAKELRSAYTAFSRDFSDIVSDPELYQMADSESSVVEAEHPDWTPAEVMTEAGKRARDWNKRRNQQQETETDSVDMTGKLEEKRSMQNLSAGTGRKAPVQKGPQVETNSAYIARLRKERGLE